MITASVKTAMASGLRRLRGASVSSLAVSAGSVSGDKAVICLKRNG
ncbi:hypothetical protein [Pyruvatibacter mobilis]